MRYVIAKYKMYQKERTYRIYISDTLYYRGLDKHFTKRYVDFIKPQHIDHRSGDEIALSVMNKLNLKVKE